ncbi:tandem-95 repeat protein (plasmid) [Pseudosulfitobacter pseudonitzschiae]|nr:tandem-95 repeat protein [Pseudosulfitobacter pseudonitzschiae]
MILEIIGGAQGSDILVLENKLSVAIDWHDTALANGVFIPDAAGAASASSVLDGVTADPATVVDAKAETAAFFNTAPVAGNDFVTINEDGVINGNVGDDTSDADGDTLTHSVEAGDGASNGTVVMNADGTYTYTPNADFNGTDSFTYTVKDGKGGVDTATVNVTVTAVNDAPVAQDGIVATTAEDNSVSGSVASSDVDGGAPTYSVSGNPANGSVTMNPNGTYTYTPNDDFNGSDSFEYTVNDGKGGVDTATVNITVTAVDDAPVAQDESASVNEDAFILNGQLDANDIDNDNANITFSLNAAAPAGLTVLADGSYTFDASVAAYQNLAAGVTQVITAGYTATSNGKSDTGTITITVTGTNDAPVAQAASASTVEDTAISGTLSATDKDNGDTLTYSLATGAANGDVTVNQNGTFVYDPNANFNGVDSFTYTVTDSAGATSTATVNIGVSAVDDVLTAGVDIINGGQGDDIIIGNENTLNAGDSVTGGDGTDTVIVNVETGVDVNIFNQADDFSFGGFSLNVETFQTTVDGDGSATFDMSGSEITGNTFINSNSSGDVTFNAVNMTAGGTNGDDNNDGLPDDLVSLELRNVTNSADTTVTTRPAQVSGATDAANILATNVDSNAIIGDVSFFGAPNSSSASGIETFNLSTAGSAQMVSIEDLNTPGATTLNIAADTTGLIIGDPDADVGSAGTVGDRQIVGFENDLSSTINVVDGSASTGGFGVGLQDAINGVTVTGGAGNDTVEGSSNDDSISGNGGADLLDGDDGNDTINGGEGNDTLFGGNDDDLINGGDNNDVIDGGEGNDILNGDAGNDSIHTGNAAADEIVDGGAGNDNVTTNVQFLDGTDNNGGSLDLVDQLSGGAGDGDTLFLEGTSSSDVNGLNYVQQFENIELDGTGTHTFTIGNNSVFENDHDARAVAGGSTTIDGRSSGGSVVLDLTTLDQGMSVLDSNNNDTILGTAGDDEILFSGGTDVLRGGAGNDTFIGDPDSIEFADTIDGDGGNDTILLRGRGAADIGAGVTGIQTLKVEDTADGNQGDVTVNFQSFDNNDVTNTSHDGSLSNGGNPMLHVDGSDGSR